MVNRFFFGDSQEFLRKRFFAVIAPVRSVGVEFRKRYFICLEENMVNPPFPDKSDGLILFTAGVDRGTWDSEAIEVRF